MLDLQQGPNKAGQQNQKELMETLRGEPWLCLQHHWLWVEMGIKDFGR